MQTNPGHRGITKTRGARIALLALASTSIACAKPRAEQTGAQTVVAKAPAAAPSSFTIQEASPLAHGTRKQMNLDVPVYVDGVARGVLRSGDVPTLPVAPAWNGAKGFRVTDYLAALGVPVARVRAAHFYANGNRIGSLLGKELRAEPNRFVVGFSSGDTGTPLARWETEKLANDFVIHEIRRVAVYVDKAAPEVDLKTQCLAFPGEPCGDQIPYAESPMAKGTRVYVDGKVIGFVKRRQLTDAMIVGGTTEEDRRYSLSRLVASFGVDMTGTKGVELLAGDDVVGRAEGAAIATTLDALYFTMPPHSHGKVRAHVPASIQGGEPQATDADGLLSAIHVYKSARVSARAIYPISEETDTAVQVARKDDAPPSQIAN